jgi:hypothetical protein
MQIISKCKFRYLKIYSEQFYKSQKIPFRLLRNWNDHHISHRKNTIAGEKR